MQLVPYEKIIVPCHLDGSSGENRGSAPQQVNANNDLDAINLWLARVSHSPQTLRSYRKEIERLLLWSLIAANKPLSSLKLEDIQAYQKFIIDPQPHHVWCGGDSLNRQNSLWKPFTGGLGISSQKQAITIISSAFNFLVSCGYLTNNPMKLISRNQYQGVVEHNRAKVERFLEQDLWNYVWQYIHKLPQKTSNERNIYHRLIFLFSLLYLQAPRVSEIANHTMNSFKLFKGSWWWYVRGKGGKHARIPVHKEMLNALKNYRCHIGLSPLPSLDDTSALVLDLKCKKGISADMIYKIVKQIFCQAANNLSLFSPTAADKLRKASTHWLRHTSLTHQADQGIDIRYLQATARHSNIKTTQRYLHKEDDVWHREMAKHKLNH